MKTKIDCGCEKDVFACRQHAHPSPTPTPWTFTESTLNGEPTGEALWLNHGHDEAHLLLSAYAGRLDQARIDAAFIVRAVNAHEKLVQVLKMLLENHSGQIAQDRWNLDKMEKLAIEQAIARAQGKE